MVMKFDGVSKKVVAFTHTDADGLFSNALVCKYFISNGYEITTERCNYDDVDKKIMGYINSYQYDPNTVIFITDISMSYETAMVLDNLPNKVVMIDHHQTALEKLSTKNEGVKPDFKWMYIREGDSATFLTWKYFMQLTGKDGNAELHEFFKRYERVVYIVDLWDTKSRTSSEFITNKLFMDKINALIAGMGFDNLKARFISNPDLDLTSTEEVMANAVMRVKTNAVRFTEVYKLPYNRDGRKYLYGLAFASAYKSEIAEYHFEFNQDLLFMVIIDLNSCSGSLRLNGRHELSEGMDLTVLAKQFSDEGGGHPDACGFGYPIKDYAKVINKVLLSDFYI